MAGGKITKKQEENLEYIKDLILERGFPPASTGDLSGCPT